MATERPNKMKARTAAMAALFSITVASCGSGGSVAGPARTDIAATADAPADGGGEQTSTEVSRHQDFVFDASTDISAFPPEFYDLATCKTSPVTSEPGATTDYGPSPFTNAADIVAAHDRVMLVEVVESQTPKMLTPVNLPAEYSEATGVDDGTLIEYPVTPVVVSVRDVIVGPDIDETVLLEIGCFRSGQLPSTQPGQQLLVFAVASDPTLGPDLGFTIDTRLRDWMSVDADGTLQPRIGLFGAPPTAPFFEGMNVFDVIDQMKQASSSPPVETGVSAEQLEGRWYPVRIDGVALEASEGDYWEFDGTDTALEISGYDGCNNFGTSGDPDPASATIVDGRLGNVDVFTEQRGCAPDVSGPYPQDGAQLTVSDDGTTLTVEGPAATIELSRTTPSAADAMETSAGAVDGPLMRHPEPSGTQEGLEAEVIGVLELDAECLYLSSSEIDERYPVLWPAGTVWDAEREVVVLPTGSEIAVGENAYGGGGYLSVSAVETIAGSEAGEHAARCVDNQYGEIAVVNNFETAIAPS